MTSNAILCSAGKWGGRLVALLLLLFWGAFFVEHVSEWFLRPDGRYPPTRVWVSMAMHFGILAGCALMLKWDRLGTVIMLAASVAFFSLIGMRSFPYISLINLLPVAFFTLYWMARRT
jgi:dolichyl-phosphate-mannose--protein O-mannosyl transferase